MKKLPNIIIFNPDCFRGDALGHMGNPAAITPNFDELVSKDGVSFQNAFSQSPVCTPSRCSFMTGWYPHVKGHRSMHHMLRKDEPNLLKTLKEMGYYVWWGGKNDLIPGQDSWESHVDKHHKPGKDVKELGGVENVRKERGEVGSKHYYAHYGGKIDKGKDGYYNDSDWDNVNSAIEFINSAPEDKPFCIYLSLTYPHPFFAVEEPWFSLIDRKKVPPRILTPEDWSSKPVRFKEHIKNRNIEDLDEEFWTELRATYYGMCSRIDHQFGLLLKSLKENDIYDDTAVFAFSDHGIFAGDYGIPDVVQNLFQDSVTRVPFIVKPPRSIKVKPGIRQALVELIDFPATVEDILGIKPEHTHFGKSLVSIIKGETDIHKDAVFCEGGRLYDEKHAYGAYRFENKHEPKEEFAWWPTYLEERSDPGPTIGVMVRNHKYKYIMRLYEDDELYDLSVDPQENNNLIDDSSKADVLSEMKDRLLKFYLETGSVVPHDLDDRFFKDSYNNNYKGRKFNYK